MYLLCSGVPVACGTYCFQTTVQHWNGYFVLPWHHGMRNWDINYPQQTLSVRNISKKKKLFHWKQYCSSIGRVNVGLSLKPGIYLPILKKSGVRSWYDWFLSRWNWIMKTGCLDRHPTAVEHLLFNHTICIRLGVRLKLQFFPYARTQIRYSSCRERTGIG